MFDKRDELLDAVDHACFQIVHMAKGVEARRPRLRKGTDFESVYKIAMAKKNSEG